jgi:hypothetical protein
MTTYLHLLSSRGTFLVKILFPIVWTPLMAALVLGIFLSPIHSSGPDAFILNLEKGIFIFIMLVVGISILSTIIPLKRVLMDDKALYISNYLTEIIVPLNNVSKVSENRWANYRPVTICFRTSTKFGNKISFMPQELWITPWSPHAVVEEIQMAVDLVTNPTSGKQY